MAFKKCILQAFLPSCFKADDETTTLKSNKQEKKQSSSSRLSWSDWSSTSTMSEDLSITLAGSNVHVFTFQELKMITHNFSSTNFLGQGGFGPVYKGFVDDKLRPSLKARPVAVKVLDLDGTQGHREWLTEVILLGELRHSNLVKLIGYCCEEDNRLLVYQYMPRGSLENQLFRRFSISLSWSVRMNIAHGAAKGLASLHEAEKQVIFRDFKASNILLDSDYTAKLSDFGLAKDGPKGDETHVTTRVMGTHGYAAPEYIMTGHLTAASDVFSYGVVLLELLTGRKSVDKGRPHREQNLVEWARPQLKDPRKLRRIMDPRLEGMYSETGAQRAAELAYQCLSHTAKCRPTMRDVVNTLEPLKDFDDSSNQIIFYSAPQITSENLPNESPKKEIIQCHRKNKLHQGHKIHRTSSPNSPRIYSDSALKQRFLSGLKSSTAHQRA